MKLLHHKRFLRLLAALALFAFAGDLAADVYADFRGGHCDAQSSQSSPTHEKSPCSHCSCAAHIGAVVVGDFAVRIVKNTQLTDLGIFDDGARPTRRATSIDHPPQLA
jgi:anaerobic selenocysteine-containing dehydrogenase